MSRRTELLLWTALFPSCCPGLGFPLLPLAGRSIAPRRTRISCCCSSGRTCRSFAEYYTINHKPAPNWLGHLALAGLILISNPLLAEKILLTGYILALPLAVRYAFRAIRSESATLAVLSFPFLYNCLLHYGFYISA